jgi:PEP-CTERM motif
MKAALLASAAILAASSSAFAANLITFAQTSNTNQVVATTNIADTQTTLTVNNAAVSIGQFIAGAPPATSFFDLNATSIDPATTVLTAVIQHYSGSFCITTAVGCGGTNILSGTFSDAAFGALGGPGLVVNVNSPPDTLALTSSLIPASELASPSAFGLTFTNLTPALAILGTTIAPFNATFAGDASASTPAVFEPSSLAIVGLGLVGLGVARRRRRSTPYGV